MKLRYYLRGLGLGMIVTALVLTLAGGDKETLSDEEIKRRAAQLGMVESSSLTLTEVQNQAVNESAVPSDKESSQVESSSEAERESSGAESSSEPEQESSEAVNSSEAEQESSEVKSSGETEQENSEAESSDETEKDISEMESSGAAEEENGTDTSEVEPSGEALDVSTENTEREVIKVTVQAGESSYAVSLQLEEFGLIEDALSFDTYLCNIGYSRVIHTGTHRIAVGSTEEEIAKIITGKR